MPEITISISQAVWEFLNKKGEPADVAKQIIESAWEADGWNDVMCNSKTCKVDCSHTNPHTSNEHCAESCCYDPDATCIKVML